MRKFFLLGTLFAAGLSFTACSSGNEEVAQEPSLDNKFDAQGKAYVNIAINMPTSGGVTRANDEFTDGSSDEFKVEDAVLLLFNGKNDTREHEDAATFISASKMNNKVSQGNDGVRISDRILFTQQISKGNANLAGATGLLAFLVVNHNEKFAVNDDNTLKINGSSTNFTGTFGDLKNIQLSELGNTTNGLLMTNAPMSSKAGGASSDPSGALITYLTEIKSTDIYNSEADAYAGTSFVDIFVERAAAKVSVLSSASGTLLDGSVTYNASNLKWEIQNTNTKYYVERHISNSYFGSNSANLTSPGIYRFADSQVVGTGYSLYRTYWAEDGNMSAVPENVPGSGETKVQITDFSAWNSLSSVQYIAENAVDQNSLKQQYTTRLVLAVPFNNGNDFYTCSWQGGDKIYSTSDMTAEALAFVKTLPSYTTWKAANSSYDVTGVSLTPQADGSATFTAITATAGATSTDAILTEAKAKAQLSFFKNGMAYYKVLIKHFGDNETPLPTAISGTAYNDIYGSDEASRIRDFLGRYSVVRNNWYQIDLQGIRHIGKPSVPDVPTDTPDDEIDAYLKVRINVLSWGVRKQGVVL